MHPFWLFRFRFTLVSVLVLCTAFFSISSPAARFESPLKIADSSSNGYGYGYAPSMVYQNGLYHCWYGSAGTGEWDWDHIRYVWSTDGVNWSAPQDLIQSVQQDRAACDPSVVYYQGYWYCFYSGCPYNIQTAHFVARASSPSGPFYKYTDRGTWEINPPDPHMIIAPVTPTPEGSGFYGAGQASVVVRNGRLHMWWMDNTTDYPQATIKILYASTTDPLNWPAGTDTGIRVQSVDVKYDPYKELFAMYAMENHQGQAATMVRYFSRDGLHWTAGVNHQDLPDYSHNPGVLGDEKGHIIFNTKTIYGYGAPYDLRSEDKWAEWDLYGSKWRDLVHIKGDFDGDGKLDACMVDAVQGRWYIKSSLTGQQGTPEIPWGWQWLGMGPQHRIACADYTGDGKTNLAIVDDYTPGGSSWYVLGCPEIPWGWQWTGMAGVHQLVLGDYDGDGKTDRAIADIDAPGGTRWFIISSQTGGIGVPNIPFGSQIPGQSSHHDLILGDYDGDGKTDRAFVDRYASGGSSWYVLCTGTNQPPAHIPWGWQWPGTDFTFMPVVEDYDGDGITNRALVGNDYGTGSRWYVLDGGSIPWGWEWPGMLGHFKTIPGDYNGDGIAERTIVGPDIDSTGARWYSLDNPSHIPFGWQLTVTY